MDTIQVRIFTTYFSVPYDDLNYQLQNKVKNFCKFNLIPKKFNFQTRKWEVVGKYVIYRKKRLHIPIAYLDDFLDIFPVEQTELKYLEPAKHNRNIGIQIDKKYQPRDIQLEPIEFLSKKDSRHIRCLNLGTGIGKTFCSIYAISKLDMPAIVIVDGLTEQWQNAIKQFTGDYPYTIQGFKSFEKLIESDYKPKIILCSLGTARRWVEPESKYDKLLSWNKFCSEYEIGVKVIDEAHKAFTTVNKIDLLSNIDINIYLTATFMVSNEQVLKIYKRVFSDSVMYSKMHKAHIDTRVYEYTSGLIDKQVLTKRGYAQYKFEKNILKRKTVFKTFMYVLTEIINVEFIKIKKDKDKLLIYFTTHNLINAVKKSLSDKYPDLKIEAYLGGDDDEILKNNDIILTTQGSAGEGTDIANLRVVINAIGYKTPLKVTQTMGRLRKRNDTNVIYVDMYDSALTTHANLFNKRKDTILRWSKSYKEYTI